MPVQDNQQHTSTDIIELFSTHKSWEDKYRQILQLAKRLAPMNEEYQTEEYRVKGCESEVFLKINQDPNTQVYHFEAASNARIVRGLLVIILAAYQRSSKEQISTFDIKDYFGKLDLLKHLSPSRANGIHAICEKIRQLGQ